MESNESDENVDMKKTATKKKGGKKSASKGKGSRGANSPLSFEKWNHDDFLGLCAMSGCDFLENVRNVGFKRPTRSPTRIIDVKTALEMMSKDPKIEVPEDYIAKWQKAVYTFKHALIYDIKEKKLEALDAPLPEELLKKTSDELDFWEKLFDNKVAIEIVKGRMDPHHEASVCPSATTLSASTSAKIE